MIASHFWSPRRMAVQILLLTLIVTTASGVTESSMRYLGLDQLATANDRYLETSFERSLRLFALLSAVKVGLAVIEGSEVGVGFGLELGDLVQSVYDHVDIAWRTVLAASVILKGMQYLLNTADLLDHWFLTAALVLIWAMLIWRWALPGRVGARRLLRDSSMVVTLLALTLYLTLPLSVAGGRMLSFKITEPSLQRAEKGLKRVSRELGRLEQPTDEGWLSGLQTAKRKIDDFVFYVKSKTGELVDLLMTLITVYIFDSVVFPLALFLFLLWFSRLTVRYLLGIKRESNFKEDLRSILAGFYGEPSVRRKG